MAKGRTGPMDKRLTISFSRTQAEILQELAERNDVSISWVVRLAVDDFLRNHPDRQLRLNFNSAAGESPMET